MLFASFKSRRSFVYLACFHLRGNHAFWQVPF
jgi:hypothetical protein